MPLEGKVTNILNDRELAINVGKNTGVIEQHIIELIVKHKKSTSGI